MKRVVAALAALLATIACSSALAAGPDWSGAKWIGGAGPQAHDWNDMTETVAFRVTNPQSGITFMFHARPVGKTWGEFYSWQLNTAGPLLQLVESTSHYAGNTGVPGGSPAVAWGTNYYDPQGETNPTATGTRSVAIATLQDPTLGDVNAVNLLTDDHELKVSVSGHTVTTWLDGAQIDHRTLSGDQLQSGGTIGFASGSGGVVRSVKVEASGQPRFFTDFAGGANPFEAGNPGSDGLNLTTAGAYPATATQPGGPSDLPTGALAKDIVLPIARPAPLLRDEFTAAGKRVSSAVLNVAAGGYPALTLNARALTVDGGRSAPHLIPDQSNYDKTLLYDSFDVTRLIRSGRSNVLAAELGRGWYGLTTPDEWYWQMADYHGAPRMLASLVITYDDGSTQTVVTDPATWRTTDGPTTFDSVYTGEKYDARIAQQLGAWRSPGYDDAGWQHASELNPPGSCTGPTPACHGALPDSPPTPSGFTAAVLKPQTDPPVLINRTLNPVAIYETYPGSHDYIFDFGQIVSGWPHLHLAGVGAGKAGRTIRMRQDELLNGTGTAAAPYWLVEGNGNVDGDIQTDYYTASSAPTQDWQPSFSYSGFRYVEVRGLYDVLGRAPVASTDAGLLTAKVARSGFATTGAFESSNALLNRIWQNARWAEANNSVAKETDTPTREKNGWTGDAQAGSEAEMLDFDMSRFFAQWLDQFPDSQISTGEISKIVPAAKGGYGYDQTPGWNFVYGPLPAWDAALFVIPSELHTYYGNDAIFARLYPTQKRLMDYYAKYLTPANDYTYRTWLGEYGSLQTQLADPVTPVINQQYYFYFADYMANVARLLGYPQDAAKYRALADAVKASFIAKYWDANTGAFTGANTHRTDPTAVAGVNVESVNAMAIAFGMVPGSTPAERAANEATAAAAIAHDLRAHANHIGAGVYGLHYLFEVLDRFGYTNLAYSAATQTTPGSYGHQIAEGATSLWELWEVTPAGTFSHDHHYYSSINTWFYQGLAGIQPAAPGYARIQVIPHVPTNKGTTTVPATVADELTGKRAPLDHVKASIRTARGLVSSAWQRLADGKVGLRVCIPAETPAEVWVPTMDQAVDAPRGAAFVRHDTQGKSKYDVYSVGAGCFAFNR